jgi:hypothetical protein
MAYLKFRHRNQEPTMPTGTPIDFAYFHTEARRLRRAEMAAFDQALLCILRKGVAALRAAVSPSRRRCGMEG